MKKKYDALYRESEEIAKQEEKLLLDKYYSTDEMSKETLSIQIMKVRENNEDKKEKILLDKEDALKQLDNELEASFVRMGNQIDDDTPIMIVWDKDSQKYNAIEK